MLGAGGRVFTHSGPLALLRQKRHMHWCGGREIWELQPGSGLLYFWGEGNLGVPLNQGAGLGI